MQAISERLAARGYEVQVLTTNHTGILPKEESINGVKVKRFKSFSPGDAYWFSKELKSYLAENSANYDIVHAHSYHAFPAFYATTAKAVNKLIFTPHYHGTGHTILRRLLHYPYAYFGKKIFEKADRVICVSNYEKKLILRKFKHLDGKIDVIPNGIDLKEYRILKKTGVTPNKTILYVGRLEKYKGVQNIISVLPELDGISLRIVGKGPYEHELVQLVSRLRLNDRVKFLKDLTRTELVREYAEAGLFVSLSTHEAYGICVAEALAASTPCIVADTSALSEWIDNRNVFGVNLPIQSKELVNCFNHVLGQVVYGPLLHDWDDIVEEIDNLYQSLFEKKFPPSFKRAALE